MRNKKGWMRILEATLAVILVTSVLIVVYTGQPNRKRDNSRDIYIMQREILREISLDPTFRSLVLNSSGETNENLTAFAESRVLEGYDSKLKICDADINVQPSCKLELGDFVTEAEFYEVLEKSLFVEETILFSNLTKFSPKKVKLFIWSERG